MTIICQSPLKANPNPTKVPGSLALTVDLLAVPQNTDATIEFVILDSGNCIFFANGGKSQSIPHRVSAAGTRVVHSTSLDGRQGAAVAVFDIEARVFEGGAHQCSRVCTIGVSQCLCVPRPGVRAGAVGVAVSATTRGAPIGVTSLAPKSGSKRKLARKGTRKPDVPKRAPDETRTRKSVPKKPSAKKGAKKASTARKTRSGVRKKRTPGRDRRN